MPPFLNATREPSQLSSTTTPTTDSNSSSSYSLPTASLIAIGIGCTAALVLFIGIIFCLRSRILAWKAELAIARQQENWKARIESSNGAGSGAGNGGGNGGVGGTPGRLPSVKRLKPLSFLQGREGPKEWEIRAKRSEGMMKRLSRASSSARRSFKSQTDKLHRSLSRKSSRRTLPDSAPREEANGTPPIPLPNRTASPPAPPTPPRKAPRISNLRLQNDITGDDIAMSVLKYVGDTPTSSPKYPPSVSKSRVYDPSRELSMPSGSSSGTHARNPSSGMPYPSGSAGYGEQGRRPSNAAIYPIREHAPRPSVSSQNHPINFARMAQHTRDVSSSTTSTTRTTRAYNPALTPAAPTSIITEAPTPVVTTGIQSARERRDTLSIISPITPPTASTPSAYSQSSSSPTHNSNPSQITNNRIPGTPTVSGSTYTISQRRPSAISPLHIQNAQQRSDVVTPVFTPAVNPFAPLNTQRRPSAATNRDTQQRPIATTTLLDTQRRGSGASVTYPRRI